MAHRNGSQRRRVSRTVEEAGTVLSLALKDAMRHLGMKNPVVARIAKRDKKTIVRWRTGETPVEIHRLMPSKRLWRQFWSCLTERERKAGWL